MINSDEAYLLGILFGKGTIDPVSSDEVILRFRIRFRRPANTSLRSDNIHTINEDRDFVESLKSKLSNDFTIIMNIIKNTWNIDSTIDLPNSYNIDDWGMKEIVITTSKIKNNFQRICELLKVNKLDNEVLKHFPFHLNMESNKAISLSFIQGICDSCSLVPNEASSSYGGNGSPRIQLEPPQERWELPIGMCRLFQIGLDIPVANINWGHPETRNIWRHQNHQFRVYLNCIPNNIELYKLQYKRDEYNNLYARRAEGYTKKKNCPYNKAVRKGEKIYLHTVTNETMTSELLDDRLKGISVNVPSKKNIIICRLLGCTQCKDFFDIEIDK